MWMLPVAIAVALAVVVGLHCNGIAMALHINWLIAIRIILAFSLMLWFSSIRFKSRYFVFVFSFIWFSSFLRKESVFFGNLFRMFASLLFGVGKELSSQIDIPSLKLFAQRKRVHFANVFKHIEYSIWLEQHLNGCIERDQPLDDSVLICLSVCLGLVVASKGISINRILCKIH